MTMRTRDEDAAAGVDGEATKEDAKFTIPRGSRRWTSRIAPRSTTPRARTSRVSHDRCDR